jgi:hypothetical protein
MKKLFIFAIALFYVGIASAQINTIVARCSGDITLSQGQSFSCEPLSGNWKMEDSVLYLNGSEDFVVALDQLDCLDFIGSGDIVSKGTFNGKNLMVHISGSGDIVLDVNYDNIYVDMQGSGDVVLRGECDNLFVDNRGSGDLNTRNLRTANDITSNARSLSELLAELGTNLERLGDSVDWKSFERDMERWGASMEEWGRHMEEWGEQMERKMGDRNQRKDGWDKKPHYGPLPKDVPGGHFPGQRPKEEPKPKSLLFDPHWCGFDAGLNMLLGANEAHVDGAVNYMELRPLRSWNFNFNIADVGVAFNRNHIAGLYTGIGLGWNNYSFENPIRLFKGEDGLEHEFIDESVEGRLKKSKLGVLYIQAPLMIEVRPTRSMFIAAGVTGGIRVDTWTKVKFMDRFKEKNHSDYYVNLLKLDATLRAGGNDMGFFASYNLLPLFVKGKGPDTHTFNVGFSLLF